MPEYLFKIVPNPGNIETQTVAVERLVRAKNEARATAHILKGSVICQRATTDDIVRLTKAGLDVEIAE